VSSPSSVPTIYKKNFYASAIKITLLTILTFSIGLLGGVRLAIVVTLVPLVLIGTQLRIEARRAIILSPQRLEYRWGSGKVEVVQIADITRIEEASVAYMFAIRPVVAPGVKLVLKSGEEKSFPIDFPARQEILSRLRSMVPPA
jgi:hypothetical protein